MPKSVKMLAPTSAPATRAESWVVRDRLSALISVFDGMVSAISAPRTPRSDGRTRPMKAVTMTTTTGLIDPDNANNSSVEAHTA